MSDLRSGPPNGPFFASASVKPCSVTMHQTRRGLEVLHAIGVGEIARQLRVRALDDAGSQAEVAAFERDVLRAARLLPQHLAARFPQLGRIAVLQRRAVFRDLVDGAALAAGRQR